MRSMLWLPIAVLAIGGCSAQPSISAKPDADFISQATAIMGHSPSDPAKLIASIKGLCSNGGSALTLTVASKAPEAPISGPETLRMIRAGVAIYCPDLLPDFDAATP